MLCVRSQRHLRQRSCTYRLEIGLWQLHMVGTYLLETWAQCFSTHFSRTKLLWFLPLSTIPTVEVFGNFAKPSALRISLFGHIRCHGRMTSIWLFWQMWWTFQFWNPELFTGDAFICKFHIFSRWEQGLEVEKNFKHQLGRRWSEEPDFPLCLATSREKFLTTFQELWEAYTKHFSEKIEVVHKRYRFRRLRVWS